MTAQLTLSFVPGIAKRHRSLRECMAAGVYQRGLARTAADIDVAPSKLSEKLSGGCGDRVRDVGLDEFERYLQQTGDLDPLMYLVDKFLQSPEVAQQVAQARASRLLVDLRDTLAQAGIAEAAPAPRGRGRR